MTLPKSTPTTPSVPPLDGVPIDPTDEVASWIVRMNAGRHTEADNEAFHKWLASSPENPTEYRRALRIWIRADALRRLPVFDKAAQSEFAPRLWPRRRRAAWIGIALAAGMGALSLIRVLSPDEFVTQKGEQRDITFLDGSRTRLNTDTVLRAHVTPWSRGVHMAHGEALFEIVEDRRPFVVSTRLAQVEVVGTRFTVRSEHEKLLISVLEGTVLVASQAAGTSWQPPVTLHAGMQLVASASGGRVSKDARAVEAATSWIHGSIEFADVPLATLIPELNRYSPRTIELADSDISSYAVSGSLRISDIAGFLEALSEVLPLRVTYTETAIRIERRDTVGDAAVLTDREHGVPAPILVP